MTHCDFVLNVSGYILTYLLTCCLTYLDVDIYFFQNTVAGMKLIKIISKHITSETMYV